MLKHRLATGIPVGLVFLAILFVFPVWTRILLLFAVFLVAQTEFSAMVRSLGVRNESIASILCGGAFLVSTIASTPAASSLHFGKVAFLAKSPIPSWAWILIASPAVFLLCGIFRRKTDKALESFALSLAGFWYVPVLLSFVIRIAFEWPLGTSIRPDLTGQLMILLFILLVKFGDIGGYAIGCSFGRHKLIPEISPGKTVEGLAGCYAFSLFVSLIVFFISGGVLGRVRMSVCDAIILPILMTTAGVFGDLAESLFKRSVGLKDSSAHFPGLGGLLDILDSLLFSAPVMYFYILAFLK